MSASEYKSPFSVGKRQTIFIDVDDPRVQGYQAALTAARAGAEIVIVNGDGGSLLGSSYAAKMSGKKQSTSAGTPKVSEGKTPGNITNLSAEWQELDSGPALVFSFTMDLTSPDNSGIDSFYYTLNNGSTLTPAIQYTKLNTTSSSQQIIFYYSDNTKYFGNFQPSFTEFKVQAHDKNGNLGTEAILTDIPTYVPDLCIPEITVTSIPMGYSVTLIDVCTKPYEYISVEEIVSDAGTAPTTGYQQVYLSDIKPATILTPTTEARWVKARYTSRSGLYGLYSNAVKVIPTNPVSVDLIPPSEVASVSGTWSGDNIVIDYTLPATDAGTRFQIALTAPNSSVGYFYAFPSGVSLNQTFTITKADLFAQFGSHYSSYTGVFKSIDASDNRSGGISFTIGQRPNPLLGVVPVFTTTALVNGYSVSFTLAPGAVYAEIYQKYTSWSGVTPIDSFTGTYSSGGASGTNTVTLSGVITNKGVPVTTIPTGYRVVGDGIPNNTYITSVSGNQITVNNNFTSQVSGSITGYGIVYSGISPANISSTIYENTHLLIRYYDDFENPSDYSVEQIVVPLSPVTVDITGPGNVSSIGMSTDPGIDTSGTLGFNGYINLSWSAVTESSMRGYRIRFTTDTVSPVYSYVDYPIDQNNIPTGTLYYKLEGLSVGATYKIAIATYDQYNNTSTDYISFTDTQITGTPAITDYITAGNFQFGQGVDPTNTTGITGMKRGLFFDDSNYWFLNASDSARLKIGGSTSNYLLWDGSKFTVDGDITARGGSFSGNIALTTSGASIYSGDVLTSPGNLTGDGFIFNKDGILIRKGTNQVSLDTTNGAITANNGNIADWVISASKIEKLDPTSTRYAGLSSTGLYKFWAGSTVSGGDTTQFAVDRTGKVWASAMQISGGQLDIGAPSTNLSAGFHVTSAGLMYATGATVNGVITATSGKITGNFQVESGSFYAGTSATSKSVIINSDGFASVNLSGAATTVVVNTPISFGPIPSTLGSGATLADPDDQINGIGSSVSNPLKDPANNTLPITFFTKAAMIGGWVISDYAMTDRSRQFVLDSRNKKISITGIIDESTNYSVRLGTDLSNPLTGTDNIFEAGTIVGSLAQKPNIYITRSGILNARSANLQGLLTTNLDGAAMKFGQNAGGTGNDGIYIDPNDYWYKDGSAKFGNGNIEILTDGTVKFATGSIEFNNIGDFQSDENNYAGDPTITLNTSNKLTQGRRLIYNGTANPTSTTQPGSIPGWNSITGVGTFYYKNNSADEKPCKVGDLIFTT